MNQQFFRQHRLRFALFVMLLLLLIWVYDGWQQLWALWQAWPALVVYGALTLPGLNVRGRQP